MTAPAPPPAPDGQGSLFDEATGRGMRQSEIGSWLARALIAISEEMCPNHLIPLRATGWCVLCQLWYRADFPAQTVYADYPVPVTRLAEL